MTAAVVSWAGLALGGVVFGRDVEFEWAVTPYGHPIHACGRTPDPHYAEQEATSGAARKAYVDGTPEYRAWVTADLRRDDLARFQRGLDHAKTEADREYYRAMLEQAREELAEAEAVLMAAEGRIAA